MSSHHSSATNVRDMDMLLKVVPAGSDAYCVRDHIVTESAAAVCTPVPTVEALTRLTFRSALDAHAEQHL